ncbi:MAG: T9SS type A sorting domain-containing protein, partial [Bacteroidetes bacterium]|nr:T9SS type A sorting domain-containing protein [Bacteroidota bacterium]
AYTFRTTSTGAYNVNVQYSTTAPATLVLEYNGNVIGTYNLQNTNGTATLTAFENINCTADKLHSIRTVVTSGTVKIIYLNVTTSDPTGIAKNSQDKELSIYPNPASGDAVIEYFLTQSGQVMISLYNVLGKEVMNIINEEQNTGTHKINMNTTQLSNGIYFVKIQADGEQLTQKFIINKSL